MTCFKPNKLLYLRHIQCIMYWVCHTGWFELISWQTKLPRYWLTSYQPRPDGLAKRNMEASKCKSSAKLATIIFWKTLNIWPGTIKISLSWNIIFWHSLKAVNDMVNDKNALSVNHTQLNLAESKSHSGIRAECILHMAVSIGVIDWVWFTLSNMHSCHWPKCIHVIDQIPKEG